MDWDVRRDRDHSDNAQRARPAAQLQQSTLPSRNLISRDLRSYGMARDSCPEKHLSIFVLRPGVSDSSNESGLCHLSSK